MFTKISGQKAFVKNYQLLHFAGKINHITHLRKCEELCYQTFKDKYISGLSKENLNVNYLEVMKEASTTTTDSYHNIL